MTREEAAEIILEGRAFATCEVCRGSGLVDKSTWVLENVISCPSCLPDRKAIITLSSGKVLRPQYSEACLVLGITPPSTALRETPLKRGEND